MLSRSVLNFLSFMPRFSGRGDRHDCRAPRKAPGNRPCSRNRV